VSVNGAGWRKRSNLRGGTGVTPADKYPHPGRENIVFRSSLKRSVASLAIMAGLLALAGPASAQGVDLGATGLKFETEVVDYVRLSTAPDSQRQRGDQPHNRDLRHCFELSCPLRGRARAHEKVTIAGCFRDVR
jgi:hypothetical protein